MRLHKELKKHSEKENRDMKNRDPDDRDPDIENNKDTTMHRLSEKRKSVRKDYGDDKDASKSECFYFTASLHIWKSLFGFMFLFIFLHPKILKF